MNQKHDENRGVPYIANHLSTALGLEHTTMTMHTYRQHTMNGTIQKKKDSRSDSHGLLFVFECIVVIISSIYSTEDSHYKDRPSLLCNFQYRELIYTTCPKKN